MKSQKKKNITLSCSPAMHKETGKHIDVAGSNSKLQMIALVEWT